MFCFPPLLGTGVARIFSMGVGGSKVDDLCIVVVLNTQAKTDKINHFHPPTLPAQQKFDFFLCPGVHLTTYPYKLHPRNFSSALGDARAPIAPPGYTYDAGN